MNTSNGQQERKLYSLQLARYRFHWHVSKPLQLPPYASSTLRGVFGRAFRQLACLTRASDCLGCAVLTSCPYPELFEPQRIPRPLGCSTGGMPALAPYAIETPFAETSHYQPGSHYAFDMVLMTPAVIRQLPLIVTAWRQAFARGVGPRDGKAELIQVEHLTPVAPTGIVYSSAIPQLQRHKVDLTVPQFGKAEDVKLHLQTPLRIEQQGKVIKERDMTTSLFLRHLIRRVSFHVCAQQADAFLLEDIHQLNALADQVQEGQRQLTWSDWTRYSSRQKQKMTLGGLIGHWRLLQVPAQILPFIYLGQWLHVGKESAFGLGKYQWQSPPSLSRTAT